jgi:CheY-like chemotaxis protein
LDLQLNPVKVDLHQLEQVIVNLAVNARDAMPKGGRLTIETSNMMVDKSVNARQLVESGNHVILTVSDTGVGMDAETQSHIFEPFFTTKKQGKGTGLGLATVYGIIQQSGGHIDVTSAPDQGTTFTIYLPQAETSAEPTIPEVVPSVQPITGSETILLVEDETGVRTIIRKFLQKGGYTVLEGHNSEEALNISQEYEGTIHLLVTDIMMPGLSGPELAERLTSVRPAIKVLYMSGYVDEAVSQQSLTSDAIILQKPFTPDILGRGEWEVLHSPANDNIGSTR